MRVHNPIGSKQRLVEIFQKVNKVKLNEDFNSANNDAVVTDVLEKIKNGTITIKNSETQASDNATFVVLIGTDANNGVVKLTVKVDTQEGDQEGVETIGNVELKQFSFRSADGQQTYDLNEDDLREFNQQHSQELYDIIEDRIDIESTTGEELADELQEAITLIDAIKIDSSPYGGGFDKMQTGKNYVDNKPTNDSVRVKSPELEQFIQEDLAPVVNKISTPEELTAYVQQLKAQGIKGLRAEDCPKLAGQALYNVAVRMADKVLPMGWDGLADVNSMWDYIKQNGGMTLQQLQSAVKRAIAVRIKEEGMTLKDLGLKEGYDEDDIPRQEYQGFDPNTAVEYEPEEEPIEPSDEFSDEPQTSVEPEIDNEPIEDVSPEKREIILRAYDNLIKRSRNTNYAPTTVEIMAEIDRIMGKVPEKKKRVFPREAEPFLEEGLNEEEKSDYPDPIGKKFKPKKHYPKKKQKHDTNVKLSEDIGSSLANIGIPMDKKAEKQAKLELGNGPVASIPQGEMNGENNKMYAEPQGDEIEQLSQEKEETGEVLQGGKGDGKLPLEFDPDQILIGLEVEKEHADNPMTAIEIVMDHLSEDPEYYTQKDTPEASAQAGASADASGEEGEQHPLAGILNIDGTEEDLIKKDKSEWGVNRAKDDDKEMTDMLLGFKPHNVGETMNEDENSKIQRLNDYRANIINKINAATSVDDLVTIMSVDYGQRPEGDQFRISLRNTINQRFDRDIERGKAFCIDLINNREFEQQENGATLVRDPISYNNQQIYPTKMGESKESELKQRDPATWHQIQIAKKTMKMPGAMAGVMGGMSKEEAQRILQQRGIKVDEVQMVGTASTGIGANTDVDDDLQKYEDYKKKPYDTLNDMDKKQYVELFNKFQGK